MADGENVHNHATDTRLRRVQDECYVAGIAKGLAKRQCLRRRSTDILCFLVILIAFLFGSEVLHSGSSGALSFLSQFWLAPTTFCNTADLLTLWILSSSTCTRASFHNVSLLSHFQFCICKLLLYCMRLWRHDVFSTSTSLRRICNLVSDCNFSKTSFSLTFQKLLRVPPLHPLLHVR